ncbi:zinc-ribbon domain-containing protein [Deltaproteobacteria bacterium]|nr:zinc-ribbon domain-containing protein [Deltaproteobacteria bacterium]
MEVTCAQCKTKLNVPDEKIPKDQMVRINCPKCKNKITIEPAAAVPDEKSPEAFDETGKMHLKFIESKGKGNGEGGASGLDDYDDEGLDFFDEETKLALVLADDNVEEKVKEAVEEIGYKYVSVPNTRDALGKLRFHRFDLIFIVEGFDGQELDNSPILNYLNHLSMSSRRRIFIALMSDKFKTMDDMVAYTLSVNTVINTKDAEKLGSILKRGISEYEKFYKVFMDVLVETGKA